MKTQPIQQPQAGFNLPWSVAILIAGVGIVLLLVALMGALGGGEGNLTRLESEKKTLSDQAAKDEKDLADLQTQGKAAVEKLRTLEEKNKSEEERVALRDKDVHADSGDNAQKIAQVTEQIEKTKREMEKEKKKLPSQATPEQQQQGKLQAAIDEKQKALATIITSPKSVGTGIFLAGFKQPTILTTIEVAPADQDLKIKLRNPENAGDNEPPDGTARLVFADKESGLAFLVFTPQEGAKPESFNTNAVREAKRGEKVYAIATSTAGHGLGEFTVSRGTVSGTNIVKDGRKYMQLAVPTNMGALGAPVIGEDISLIAIVVARVEGMEKSVYAIPAVEIQKAVDRMIEKMKQK